MLLGTGILSWPPGERRSDRYGCILLLPRIGGDDPIPFSQDIPIAKGTLYVIVIKTRSSTHIGDIFRSLYPETPNIGEKLILGEGTLFFDYYNSVGVRPDDRRESDWLDPKALYRAHEQTVELYFEADD